MTTRLKLTRSVRVLSLASGLFAIGAGLFFKATVAAPVTFTVTNTNGSGAGSLSQAITSANSNGNPSEQDVISFQIPVSGNVDITPDSTLSVTQSVKIDGYSQADAVANTVVAPGPLDGTVRVGVNFASAGALQVIAPNVTLQGLVLYGGHTGSVSAEGATNLQLYGNYFDVKQDGLTSERSSYTTDMQSLIITNSADVSIGGSQPAERNIFGSCIENCISAQGATTTNLSIKGNYIGLGADGITTLPFPEHGGTGIDIRNGADLIAIGGANAGEGNIIAHNYRGAIAVQDSSELSILGNRVVFNSARDTHGGAGLDGAIFIGGVTQATIGSAGAGRNVIARNAQGSLQVMNSVVTGNPSSDITVENNYFGVVEDGVSSLPNTYGTLRIGGDSQGVILKDNIIKNNLGTPGNAQGILNQANAQPVTMIGNIISNNDGLGIYNSGAGQLSAPGYTQVTEASGMTTVQYTINVPAGDYRIEFFQNTNPSAYGPGEGETLLGYQNITTDSSGLQQFSKTLPGVGHTNLALTATKIDGTSWTGYGMTSQFGAEGQPYVPPVSDLATSLTLNNPSEVKLNHVLDYTATISNTGPDPIDISKLNGSIPGQNDFTQLILPPQLQYLDSTDTNVSCTDLGAGSAGTSVTYLSNHTDSSIAQCEFTGSQYILNPGDSYSFSFSGQVTTKNELNFSVYALGGAHENDPDIAIISGVEVGGQDLVDEFVANPVNNFASAQASQPSPVSSDLAASISLINPQDLALGGVLQYPISITNNGPNSIDIGELDGATTGQDNLAHILLPAQLEYSGVSGSNVACVSNGAGSAASLPYLANHSDYSTVTCNYTGGEHILNPGESISFTVQAQVINDTTLDFSAYVLGGVRLGDPDQQNIANILSSQELIDILSNGQVNNFAKAASLELDGQLLLTLDNPQSHGSNADLVYTASYINNGPGPLSLSQFDGVSDPNPLIANIFTFIIPPNLSFVASDNPDLQCTWLGPGIPAGAEQVFRTHLNYSAMFCSYIGTTHYLYHGQSFAAQLHFTDDGSSQDFTNYVFGGITQLDSNSTSLFNAFDLGENTNTDALDNLVNGVGNTNNFASARFSNNPSTTQSAAQSSKSQLSKTGQSLPMAQMAAILTVFGSLLAAVLLFTERYRQWSKL